MTSKLLPSLLIGLIVVEILSTLVSLWTRSRYRRIVEHHLAGRSIESLSESDRKQVFSAAADEYNRTAYRKIDLLVITFHLPALASWVTVTRQSRTPPLYYYGVTMLFWFVLLFGATKIIAKFRGA